MLSEIFLVAQARDSIVRLSALRSPRRVPAYFGGCLISFGINKQRGTSDVSRSLLAVSLHLKFTYTQAFQNLTSTAKGCREARYVGPSRKKTDAAR